MKIYLCLRHLLRAHCQALYKAFLLMKLTVIIIVLTFLKVNAHVHAQQITLTVKQAPIIEVLGQIEKQSGYQFFYDDEVLAPTQKVSLTLKNAEITEALNKCFAGQPLAYQIIDKTIVIKRKETTLLDRVGSFIKELIMTGQVTDANGQPIAGVTVMVKNSSTTTITDGQGRYTIRVPENGTLIFSSIGYETIEIPVANKTNLNLMLKEAVGLLDKVQIIGYGTTTQRLNTGNVGTVSAQIIGNQPITNPMQALAGRIAGVTVNQSNGLPGSGMSVQIRGRNSIAASNVPLYVVDGVPFPSDALVGLLTTFSSSSPLNSINPGDIESISVLKDADATAIYGSRAANGVILITTKKGQAGKTKFEVNLNNGYGSVTRTAKPLSTSQYLQLRRDAFANSGILPTATTAPDLLVWDQNTDNNLQEWYMGNTTQQWDANGSVGGGSAKTRFLISGNYHQESTVFSESDRYKRGGVHFNISHKSINEKLSIDFIGFYSQDNNRLKNSLSNTVAAIATSIPNYPIFDNNGNYNWTANLNNVVAVGSAYWKSQNKNLNANLKIAYLIIPGLEIKSSFGYNRLDNEIIRPNPASSINPAITLLGSSAFGESHQDIFNIEPQLNFTTSISKGKFELLIGNTIQANNQKRMSIPVFSYINELLLESPAGGTVGTIEYSQSQYNFISIFGRVNYNWLDKYIVNASFRKDGSSRFGTGKKYGNFGSIGIAWLFKNEALLKDKLDWFSFGKLRGSYGSTGSDGIGDYGYLSLYNSSSDYGGSKTIIPSQLANSAFQWEVNKKLEFALELGFLKDRILLNSAWYRNRSNNQLVIYPLPSTTGFSGYTANLPAEVQNSGWEFELNTQNIKKKDFGWNTSFNLTIPKNKLVSFPNIELTSYANTYVVGKSLNSVLRYQFLGVDPATGLSQIEDINGVTGLQARSSYNNQGGDYVLAGNRDPKWYGGINNSIRFKGLQLDVFFQYVNKKDYNLYNNQNANSFGTLLNVWETHLDYWKQPGDQSFLPKPLAGTNSSYVNFVNSTEVFSDASFLRLKNLALSYSLPNKWINKAGLSNFRIVAQGQNLWTITKYIGYDPETTGLGAQVPPLKMFSFGLQASL
ncbi:TonB-dependent receptor [Pedobacter sp. ASV28]|uniref:TonB-dependent receptor n=1 Tax=Pedobacter sp. ASV28 TaxID=2795123 RepID=UPI0018ED07E0|nr:TonB-dependent receptor [Pedobacter sp. ASV28]